eukprot:993226-Alexandrium_andersonii.AAC.1
MSASLVGSEMCIRDRLRRDASVEVLFEARTSSSCRRSSEPSTAMRSWSCLLYTSDAADDM